MKRAKTGLTGIVLGLVAVSPALAHIGDIAHYHGFMEGVAHPLTGLDHFLAMLTIGLWAGVSGGYARWVWPLTFVSVAGLGALYGYAGYALPAQEPLIAISVIVLGGLVYASLQMPLFAGMVLSGGAAFVHGYAHGVEMPVESAFTGFMTGFLLSTALLHGLGLAVAPRFNGLMQRLAGGLIAGCGTLLLVWAI